MKIDDQNSAAGQTRLDVGAGWLLLWTSVGAGLLLVAWVMWRVGDGFDLTDESFYLSWISHPRLYTASVTQFGSVYHPVYQLVGGDVVLLRRVNIFITLALGWLLGMALFRSAAGENSAKESWRSWNYAGVAFVLATSTLALLAPWLPTPNYNSLAFQALLIAGTGIILAEATATRASKVGWTLIGVAGWLAFLAKPTTAAALALVVGVYLLAARKLRIRLLAISLVTMVILAVLSAWYIDGSIVGFVNRLRLGVADVHVVQGRYSFHEIMRWDDFGLSREETMRLRVTTGIVFLVALASYAVRPAWRVGGAVLGLVFPLATILMISGVLTPHLADNPLEGLQIAAAPFGAGLAVLLGTRRNWPKVVPLGTLALAACFVGLPHVFAFGTNKSYWFNAPAAGLFWVLAGVALLGSRFASSFSWRTVLPVAAGAQACTVVLLLGSMEFPYRQTQPLRKNADFIVLAATGSKVRVSREFAQYAESLKRVATAAGFKVGEPMIDLTGHYPGALHLIGAKAIGLPWIIGGYKGSEALVQTALDRVPREELQRAWILVEPNGPRKLSPEILMRYGIALTKGYVEVGVINSPTGDNPDSLEQHLLKPTN